MLTDYKKRLLTAKPIYYNCRKEMEWKPSYGVFMDESYKLTYPDGKRKRLTYADSNFKRLTCLEVSEQKAQI
jgi:hypothetical protein